MDPSVGDGAVCTPIEELNNTFARSTSLDYVHLASWKNSTLSTIKTTYPKYGVDKIYAELRLIIDNRQKGGKIYIVSFIDTSISNALGRLVIEDSNFVDTSNGIPSLVGVVACD